MINLTINNKKISVPEGTTIMEASRLLGINIPSLCYLKDVHKTGSCRICVVEVEGYKSLPPSCVTPVREGMVVKTNTKKVRLARKNILKLLMSDHYADCLNCDRNQSCELQKLASIIMRNQNRIEDSIIRQEIDDSSPSIVMDGTKCILCGRCETICNKVHGIGILKTLNQCYDKRIAPENCNKLTSTTCTFCGQCVNVCPVDALKERDYTREVWNALSDPSKTVIVQCESAAKIAISEEFGNPPGTLLTGKMASALRELGFDYIFDTNYANDLNIIEGGAELLQRIITYFYNNKVIDQKTVDRLDFGTKDAPLPVISSCCPGWVKYAEHYFPESLSHLSTCRSPHMMLGSLCKNYFADKIQKTPNDIYVVSVMPCTAKKFEITRPEFINNGIKNVDAVLTVRELAKMIKEAGIDISSLPESSFDQPFALSTGAAEIFAVTGGVTEAILRTIYEVITDREFINRNIYVNTIEGIDNIKTAQITFNHINGDWRFLNGFTLKVAVASGLQGVSQLMEQVKNGESTYHFIEIMACPNGCINGGGQPRINNTEAIIKRIEGIYKEDSSKKLKKSRDNIDIKALYDNYFGKPLGQRSYNLLHTSYTKREIY